MNRILLLLCVCCSLFLNAASQTPYLTVSPTNRNVSSRADSTTFTVMCNTTWTVLSNANWCTVTPAGSGNGIIKAKVTENPAATQRIATITVMSQGGGVQMVTVTQAGSEISVEELSAEKVRIYPNPTRGIFRVVPATGELASFDLSVEDQNGKTILRKHCTGNREYPVDISATGEGIYHVVLKYGDHTITTRLVHIK